QRKTANNGDDHHPSSHFLVALDEGGGGRAEEVEQPAGHEEPQAAPDQALNHEGPDIEPGNAAGDGDDLAGNRGERPDQDHQRTVLAEAAAERLEPVSGPVEVDNRAADRIKQEVADGVAGKSADY